MKVLIGLYLFAAICAVLSPNTKDSFVHKTIYLLLAVVLLILAFIRDLSATPDMENYYSHFQSIRNDLAWRDVFKQSFEAGYVILNKILGLISENKQFFIASMSAIILIPFFLWLYRTSNNPVMSLVLFIGMGFWYQSLFIVRQWIAIVVLLYSYPLIIKKKFAPFVAMILFAALFHRTALIFAAVYFLSFIPVGAPYLLITAAVSIVFCIFGNEINDFAAVFIRIKINAGNNGGIPMLLFLWTVILVVYFIAKKGLQEPQTRIFYNETLFAAALQMMALVNSLWARIIVYFTISLTTLLPAAFEYAVETVVAVIPLKGGKVTAENMGRYMRLLMKILFYSALFVFYYRVMDGADYVVFIPFRN